MCRNHSHLIANSAMGAFLPDGSVVYIVDPASNDLAVEVNGPGGASIRLSCTKLVVLSQTQETGFYSPEALMAALVALSSVLGENDIEPGFAREKKPMQC